MTVHDFKTWANAAVGHAEAEVTQAVVEGGGETRVARRDGQPVACSRDYVPNRANLEIQDGVVTKIYFG